MPVPWLKTVGNKIVVASTDEEVTLRGVNVMRSEWNSSADVPPKDRSDCALTRKAWNPSMAFERAGIPILAGEWKGNIILRGFASDPVNAGDSQYLGVLDEHVSLAEANRMYVIFAWRSHCINGDKGEKSSEQPESPDDQAQQALGKLAARYRGKPNVMYALQVEPHGKVTWNEPKDEHVQLWPRYVEMVDAIHEAARPHKPIIMIPGIEWSRDVSGAIEDWVPRDNVVYKSHPYNIRTKFQHQFIDAYDHGLPAFIGEFGWLPFVKTKEGDKPDPNSDMEWDDVTALLTETGKRNIGWAAWILDVRTGAFQHTGLVTNASTFDPTPPYGKAVKDEMRKTKPLPADDGSLTISIDDTAFKYTGSWNASSGPAKFHGGDRFSKITDASYEVSFIGTRVKLYVATAPHHGIAGVSIDHGSEEMRDCYSDPRKDQALIYTSPALTAGPHILTVRVSGTNHPSSKDTYVSADRADISTPPPLTVNDNDIGTSPSQFQYSGDWHYAPASPGGKYLGDDHYSNSAGSTAQIELSGTRIVLYGSKDSHHGIAAVSIDGGSATMVDYHAATRQDGVAVYASPNLVAGSHKVTITVTGTRNAAAKDTVVTVDRIEVSTEQPALDYLATTYDANGFFTLGTPESKYYGYKPVKTYDDTKPISLFVWMHGCEGKAYDDLWKIAPSDTRESQSYIAISLGGRDYGTEQPDGCWQVGLDGPKLLAAVKDVQRYFNINPHKVYVGGYSSGARMAYRHGFENAGTFAGILVENGDPFQGVGSTPAALMAAASWKIKIAHLAHTGDKAFPIETVRAHVGMLRANGFNVALIEKEGTHWDPDDLKNKTGTDYDLKTELLPYLDTGWVSP